MTPAESTRAIRKQLGLTQAEFAALIGVSRPTIARAEADGTDPPPWLLTIYRLIDALGPEAASQALAVAQGAEVPSDP